jgi:hypothetical protein
MTMDEFITLLYYAALGFAALACLVLTVCAGIVVVGVIASAAAAAAVEKSENGS